MKKIIIITLVTVFAIYGIIATLSQDKTVDEEIVIDIKPLPVENKSPEAEKQKDRVSSIEQDTPQIRRGSFRGNEGSYSASGQVFVSGQDISFVDLDSTRVPDGLVYLSNDLQADEFVVVERLKGNKGNQNYRVDENINIDDYKYVLIWCRAFSVLVGSAELN